MAGMFNSYDLKYQYLISKHKDVGLKHLQDPKAFIEYFNGMKDVYISIEEYNPGTVRKVLTVFDDMIPDMISNKKALSSSH